MARALRGGGNEHAKVRVEWSRFSVPDLFSEYRHAAPEHVAHRILNVCSPLALTFSVLSEFLLTNARRFGRLLPSVSKFSGV